MAKKNDSNKVMNELSPYLNMGMQMAVTMGLGVLAGWYMDKWNQTSPMYLLIFSIVGAAVALYTFLRTALSQDKKKKKGS